MKQFIESIKDETARIDQAMREDLSRITEVKLAEIVEYAIFNGGKRIRPLLCVLAARLCGSRDERVYRLAIALEYLHVASLLHDDVIDNADQRRGRESVYKKWGMTQAILAGDYLHARSMYLVGREGGDDCLDIIRRVTAAMVEGEFLQLSNADNLNQSEDEYFAVVDGKTSLLIAAVCEMGGVFGGADQQQFAALSKYGRALGTAFQIVDDLLDYLGDQNKTGKVVGNDFCECKMTLPLIHALENSETADRLYLLELLKGEREVRAGQIGRVCEILHKTDSFDYAFDKAEELINNGVAGLDVFQESSEPGSLEMLKGLARYVLSRDK
jgi:octaprenyl-diphosphate synthase